MQAAIALIGAETNTLNFRHLGRSGDAVRVGGTVQLNLLRVTGKYDDLELRECSIHRIRYLDPRELLKPDNS